MRAAMASNDSASKNIIDSADKISKRRRMTTGDVIFLITAAAMILRLIYILATDIAQRQHDVYSFGSMEGHAGYIEFIYRNFRLPSTDPRDVLQFYHPPLHHILAALWMRLVTFFGMSFKDAGESIQYLILFYSGVYLYFTQRIFKELGLEKHRLIIAYSIVAFYPGLIIMSGSINNDMLSITLMQGAFLYAIRWYAGSKPLSLYLCAVFLGLGMMTKLSVGLAAIPIAFLIILKVLRDGKERMKSFRFYIIFAAICFPLGLWWSIRNNMLFDMPFTYIPNLGIGSHQYVGMYSYFDRLLNFTAYQFKSIYVAWGDPYFEHNVFIGLLKTATFGEQTLSTVGTWLHSSAKALFVINSVLAIIVTSFGGYVMLTGRFIKNYTLRMFANLIFVIFLASYVQFCLTFAHTCTQNIRYATPLIWISAIIFTFAITGAKAEIKLWRLLITYTLTGVFAISVSVFFILFKILD